MNILMTNHHLLKFGGTENFTLTAAKGLKKAGHKVTVYSKFIDKLQPFFEHEEIEVVSDLSLVKDRDFHIAHVHHNISAIEVRFAFPNLPIFYLCHGSLAFLEKPPVLDINIALFGAVSPHRVRELRRMKIADRKIVYFANVCDEGKFRPKGKKPNPFPKRALVLSAKMGMKEETLIRKVCIKLNIKTEFVGGRFGEIAYYGIPTLINKADIVFTTGRGVMETMLCGRTPIVFDVFGGDGMVTPQNFAQLLSRNFTGKAIGKKYTARELINEINKYNPEVIDELRNLAIEHFSIQKQIPRLEKIYRKTIQMHRDRKVRDYEVLKAFVNTIKATHYQASYMKISFRKTNHQYKLKLDEITSSKFYKLWSLYNRVKEIIAK